jgi:hypothetical protein
MEKKEYSVLGKLRSKHCRTLQIYVTNKYHKPNTLVISWDCTTAPSAYPKRIQRLNCSEIVSLEFSHTNHMRTTKKPDTIQGSDHCVEM